MVFTFFIKENTADIDITLTRVLLTISGIAALIFRSDYYFLNLVVAIILFSGGFFVKNLLRKYNVKKGMLFVVAAVLLFIATHLISFSLVLIIYGSLSGFLLKKPVILVNIDGVQMNKIFSNPFYAWSEFDNIILKDNLLSLDFKNNRLIQVNIDEIKTAVEEKAFNDFCGHRIS